jgi:chitinase
MTSYVADAAQSFATIENLGMSKLGANRAEIQANIRKLYDSKGKKILVSAFGSTDMPTTAGKDPLQTAKNLADFVRANKFHGVDLDWEDNAAMEMGTGEQWLITITKELRRLLPFEEGFIITHAPQAPYFTGTVRYKNGGYMKVDKEVGHLIDWYNIQFYNQGDCTYDSYERLFIKNSDCYFPQTTIEDLLA